MSEQAIPLTQPPPPPADAGLRCPRCDYNLTGLPEPRCPECGGVLDWEEVRQAAADRPPIYFERARGWRKVPGFVVTWATVLFAPWVFARQAVRHISTAHAVVFAILCFLATFMSVFSGAPLEFMLTWLSTAFLYIAGQALLCAVLDFSGWRQPLRSLWFWLLVGCYTSAIMPTECVHGPPPLELSELVALFGVHLTSSSFTYGTTFVWPDVLVYWAQIGLWGIGVTCCYVQRLRRMRLPLGLAVLPGLITALGVIALYSVAVQYVGSWFADLYGL